ncbi:CSMD1, partial [Symbiodinium sp. CCMP2456]
MDARTGVLTDAASAYQRLVPSGEDPYKDDSILVGNFGNTLMNSSVSTGVYIKHGSLSNIFTNLEDVTLAVATLHSNTSLLHSTLELSHPFREVIYLHYRSVDGSTSFASQVNETKSAVRGDIDVLHIKAKKPEYLALCELAAHVTTRFFVYT